jgi:hypothetical protein
MKLTFIESPIYSEQIDDLLTVDEHNLLQLALLEQPEAGDLIRGSGGLRKLRWSVAGSGKRGGHSGDLLSPPPGQSLSALCLPKESAGGFESRSVKAVETTYRALHP